MISFRQSDYQDFRHDEDWIDQKFLFELNTEHDYDKHLLLTNVNADKAMRYIATRGIALDMNVESGPWYTDDIKEGTTIKINSGTGGVWGIMKRIVESLNWDSAFQDAKLNVTDESGENVYKGFVSLKSQREGRPI